MNTIIKKSVVAYEQNYVAFPLFAFSPTKVGSKEPVVVSDKFEIDGEERTVKFELVPTQGIGGKFDHKAFRIIESLLYDFKKASGGCLPEIIPLGTLNKLALMISGDDNEDRRQRVKQFFTTMLGYHISSEYVNRRAILTHF